MDVSLITGIKYESPEFIYLTAGGLLTLLCIILAYKYTLAKTKKTNPSDKASKAKHQEATKGIDSAEKINKDSDQLKDKHGEIDPFEYSQHIPSHIKQTERNVALKKIEEKLTDEQKERERQVQREQMEAIFKLMQENQDTFGMNSKEEIQQQMKLYM